MGDLWIPESELMRKYGGQIESVEFGDHYVTSLWTDIWVRGKFVAIGGEFEIPPGELEQKFLKEYMDNPGLYKDEQLVFCSAIDHPLRLTSITDKRRYNLDFAIGIKYTERRKYSYESDQMTLIEVASRIPEMRGNLIRAYIAMSEDKLDLLDIPEVQYHTTVIKGCMDEPQENASKHNPIIVFFIGPSGDDITKI